MTQVSHIRTWGTIILFKYSMIFQSSSLTKNPTSFTDRDRTPLKAETERKPPEFHSKFNSTNKYTQNIS